MPRFKNLSAASGGAGFSYYKTSTFSFSKAGVFLSKFTGAFQHSSSTFTIPKSNSNLIMTNVLMNIDVTDSAGQYHLSNGGRGPTNVIKGSAGGFPIFYTYIVYISADTNNVTITLDVGNGSAVNDVTSDTINLTGSIFFYLAPF